MTNLENKTSLEPVLLFLLLAGALLGIALRLQLNFNGLHLDEANYLFIGKQLLAGLEWPTRHYVFSSDLPFYWLAGWDALMPGLGGRAGALVAGLVAIVAWTALICELFTTRESRLVATFLFLSQPTITAISRLATYDIVSFSLLGTAMWSCARAVRSRSLIWSFAAGLLLSAAVLAKYVTILFLPIVFYAWIKRWDKVPVVAISVVLVALGSYGSVFQEELWRLYSEQIIVAHTANSTFIELVNIVVLPLWPMVVAISWMALATPHLALLSVMRLLLGLALVLVVYHLLASDRVALYKHLAYSSAFLSILVVWLWQKSPDIGAAGRFVLVLMLCCHLGNSFVWNQHFQNAWPDTRALVSALSPNGSTEILSENAYLFRSSLHGAVTTERLHDTTYADLDGDGAHSDRELVEAVLNGRFTHIYLDGMTTPDLSQRLIDGPLKERYLLVYFASPSQLSGLDHPGTGLYSALFVRSEADEPR